MRTARRLGIAALAGVLTTWSLTAGTVAAEEPSTKPVQIGVADSLFRDAPRSLVGILSRPLKSLMESQTGISGDMQLAGDAVSLANKLKEGKVQLGVFHGYEFAWAKQHCPDLKPLVIAVAHHRRLHAHLIVAKDSPATSCADLKGKVIVLPAISRGHLHLYLERRCPGPESDPLKFFAAVKRSSGPEAALDDVIDGTAQVALVDRNGLDQFQQSNPERLNKLRVLHQSEAFPASVIAYVPGTLDDATLRKFREGLIAAGTTASCKDLLKMCRITGFEDIPADYDQLLGEMLKAYPRIPVLKDK